MFTLTTSSTRASHSKTIASRGSSTSSFASGSLEVLTLYALSESLNWRDNDITDMPIINACSTMMMVTMCGIQINNTVTQANISESQEQMIEARWVLSGREQSSIRRGRILLRI